MTEEEKLRYRTELQKRAEGYRLLEGERADSIRATVTTDIGPLFDGAFRAAKRLPLRPDSGLREYYAILMKARRDGKL